MGVKGSTVLVCYHDFDLHLVSALYVVSVLGVVVVRILLLGGTASSECALRQTTKTNRSTSISQLSSRRT